MAFGDISWGAVLVGAAAAVALVAMAPTFPAAGAFAFLKTVAAEKTAGYIGAAIVGGIAGEFASDLLGRTGKAITTISGR